MPESGKAPTMSDTCGPTSCAPFATWDRDSRSWRTSEATSLWALTLSSLTLPTWGGLQGGELFEHPTPALATSGRDFLSLPTPSANDTTGAETARQRNLRQSGGPMLRDLPTLLPTPTSQAAKHGETPDQTANGYGHNLWDLPTLLPTPAVNDMGRGKTVEEWDAWTAKMQQAHGNGNGHGKSLEIEAARIGATTAPPSPDGNSPSDDPHPHQLSLDGQAIPA
jgi:hypothetical protein